MLNHAVSYDLTLRYLDLNVKVNDEGVYHHFVTGKNMPTLLCYKVCKKGEVRNEHKGKTCCFCSKRLCNTFTQKLGLEAQFEISDGESDTKGDSTKYTNIKEGVSNGNGKVDKPDVETVDIPGDNAPRSFMS